MLQCNIVTYSLLYLYSIYYAIIAVILYTKILRSKDITLPMHAT